MSEHLGDVPETTDQRAARLFAEWNQQDRHEDFDDYVTIGEFRDAIEDYSTGGDDEIASLVEQRAHALMTDAARDNDRR